ncbi:putative HAT dimerization domain, ribonuclease H-like superfamily [Helianthus annuus]|nr:putative HAT dimerization domain, ribonuclease H-like superfamily [Helianthus annuus]
MERYFKRKLSSTFDNAGIDGKPSREENSSNNNIIRPKPALLKPKEVDVYRALPYRSDDALEKTIQRRKFFEMINLTPSREEVQKDIANGYAKEVLESIFDEIGDDVFGLLVDEFSDASNKEQIAVVLRYVDAYGIVKERFVGLVNVTEASGSSIKSAIESLLFEYGVCLKKVRGQSYYGVSDMHEGFSGLKDLLMRESGSAYFVHSFAYELELVVLQVAKKNFGVAKFFDMIAVVMDVVCTSCKQKDMTRESQIEKVKKAIGCGENEELIKDGDTRCGSSFKTLCSLVHSFSSFVEVFEYIEEEGDNSLSQRQADTLQRYFKSFDFVFYLHLMLDVIGSTSVVSRVLQRKDVHISNTISLVKSTKSLLLKLRLEGFDSLLEKISTFCEKHDIVTLNLNDDYVNPKNHKQKSNITYRHHYEFNCFNTVVDMVIQEFDVRFSDESCELLICMEALSPCDSFKKFDASKLLRLIEMYPNDFSTADRMTEYQLGNYIRNVKKDERFANLNNIADLLKVMVETRNHLSHPLVYRLLKLALILPVTPATVQRDFSAIKLMKTNLRNQIGDDLLNACLICAVEKQALANHCYKW